MATMDLGQTVLASLIKKNDVLGFYDAKLSEDYFITTEEKSTFTFVLDHVHKHGVLPAVETVASSIGELPTALEPPSYYLIELEQRYAKKLINGTLKESADLLKEKKYSEIIDSLEKTATQFRHSATRQNVMDFGKESHDLYKYLHYKNYSLDNNIYLGWPTLDKLLNGMGAGDIFSIVGRPAQGKTFLGLWIAYSAYLAQKKNVVFLSMEMSKSILTQRMSALITKANLNEVLTGQVSTMKFNQILKTLQGLDNLDQRLYFVDGALSTNVEEVAALIHQYKPDLFVIDGAYLLKHKNARLGRYERVAENIESLKQIAEKYKIPILLSYQFNRKASEKKSKGEEAGLDDIGYSDAIGQISSVVLALKQPDSAETLKQRDVTVLKGRNGGEHTKMAINWEFDKLNFGEYGKTDDFEGDPDDDDSHKYTSNYEEEFND